MVQRQLPMFPEGSILVTGDLAVEKRDGRITYFYGTLPVFTHDENDDDSFQMITAQFYSNGYVKQMDIVRAFGVTPISVKRAVKRYQEQGVRGESLFLRKLVLGIPAQASGKNLTRPLMPSAPQTSCVRATSPLSS